MTPLNRHLVCALILMLAAALSGCTTILPVRTADRSQIPEERFSHDLFHTVVARHVDANGRVDYSSLKNHPDVLERYYWLVADYSPDSHPHLFPSSRHRLAYWINAYNAGAIKTVLQYYPIYSVLDVKRPALFFFLSNKSGFFLFQRLRFGGKTTSLYYLENQVIRKRFGDARIHFALNCASKGCPRLPQEAFTGERLDIQLDREARRFLSESRNFTIDHNTKTIHLSEIFKWYEKDFVDAYHSKSPGRRGDLLSYIALYLPSEVATELQRIRKDYALRFTSYDWTLNDQADTSTHKNK